MGFPLVRGAKRDFYIGNEYAREDVRDPEEYLQTALRAEKFLKKSQRSDSDGIYWINEGRTWRNIDAPELDQSLYSGTSGILYFYLKLYDVTGREEFLQTVQDAARFLSAHWKEFFDQTPVFNGMDLKGSTDGLYFGAAGIAMILTAVYEDIHYEPAARGAAEIVEYYKTKAVTDSQGVKWDGPTGLAMDGGIILMLMYYYQVFGDEEVRKLVEQAGDRYVLQGERKPDGGLEFDGCREFGIKTSWPNYEFGTAGSGFLLTRLYEFTKDPKYLDAAKDCTIYMKSIQVPQKKGYLVPHDVGDPDEKPVYFLSSCHGPGGNSKLYYQLYKLTGDSTWLNDITEMVDGIESTGAPEKQSVGFWNTLCFCCGHAGLVQYFLGLWQNLKDERYHDLALRCAAVIMGEREDHDDGSTSWPMAFWRLRPDFLTEDTGYYDGAAGIASALLQIYLNETGKFSWHRLPDDPF